MKIFPKGCAAEARAWSKEHDTPVGLIQQHPRWPKRVIWVKVLGDEDWWAQVRGRAWSNYGYSGSCISSAFPGRWATSYEHLMQILELEKTLDVRAAAE